MSTPAERADAFLHGLLSIAEAARFERECAEDAELRAALETARRRLSVLQSLYPPTEANEALVQATLRRIADHDRRRQRLRRRIAAAMLAPLAAAALFLAFFQVKYQNLSATPITMEVYGQSTLIADSDATLRLRLWNRQTQQPLANVPVEVSLGEPGSAQFVSLASFNTDALGNGQPAIHLPDWADGSYPIHVKAQTPGQPESFRHVVWLKRSAKLMLTTDKPIYQPGQTIHVRALTLRQPDLKPVSNDEAVFTITDPRGTVIFRKTERTSRFGIASADCQLADEILDGSYRIHARVGNTDSALAVDVRKYVLPKIRLSIAADQAWYRPGQEVRVTLQANYYHGEPAADAEWNFEATNQAGNESFARLAGRLDKEGRISFVFRLPDRNAGEPQQGIGDGLVLSAKVKDAAGQEQSRRIERKIAQRAFTLSLIPESGLLVKGVANTVYVYAQTPDGSPAKVRGTLRAGGAESPLQTTDLGVAAFKITPRAETEGFEFQVADPKGNRFDETMVLRSGEIVNDYLVRTDKAVYTSGDTMHVTALSGGAQPVFVDFLKDNQMIRSEVINVKDGRGELVFDLPPEMFGTLQLIAYRFNADGVPLRKSRVFYVRPARQLAINAKPDKPEYRPGDKAKINFQLTDGQGHATPGALSLAMVDEAVFDVIQQMPGLERTFFLLEQELLKPVGTIYPWESDAEMNSEPRRQFEQAVFSRTARFIELPWNSGSSIKPQNSSSYSMSYGPTPYSLTGATYQQKLIEAEQERSRGLRWVKIAWAVFGLLLAIAIDVLLWLSFRAVYLVPVHAFGLVASCAFLLGVVLLQTKLGTKAEATFMTVGNAVGFAGGGERGAKFAQAFNPEVTSDHDKPTIRVREQFPETMLWRPQLITDDSGRASLDVDLADSITTWRLSASAVSADGRLGALQSGVRVFQPFFVELTLPVALTRNDEIEIPAVVSNFLPKAQSVDIRLEKSSWFELLGADSQKIEMKPREVRAVSFRIRVKQVGKHQLRVMARGAEFGDAVKRQIEVVPDGRRVERILNGELSHPAEMTLELPPDAIDGSGKAIVRIYPSSFSQVVEGIDGIFHLPTGCFEQTSSSLYPDVMALSYLRKTGKNMPEIEAKARQYIHVGYQRLLGFEVPDGGFDWYGRPPANIGLTAYGLMEFRDMAQVHDVDPNLISRTRLWLMAKRNADGSWPDDRRYAPEDGKSGLLRSTAYAAWAVFDGAPISESKPTRDFLLEHSPASISDPYVLALVCHALLAIEPKGEEVKPYLQRLQVLKRTSDDGRKTWWAFPSNGYTAFYGSGDSGSVEATALAVLAFLKTHSDPNSVRGGLTWIAEQRKTGNWGSTQATILALKALMEGAGVAKGDDRRVIEVALDGQVIDKLEIPADQAEVMKQVDLSARLKSGSQKLALRETTGSAPSYQVEFRYHVPGSKPAEPPSPLAIELTYDRDRLRAGETLRATAKVTNRQPQLAPMVMLDLPIPPGFAVETDDLEKLVNDRRIDRYQLTPRQIIVYLRSLEPNMSLTLPYRLRSGVAAALTLPPGRVYEYYNPAKEGKSAASRLIVTPRGQ